MRTNYIRNIKSLDLSKNILLNNLELHQRYKIIKFILKYLINYF